MKTKKYKTMMTAKEQAEHKTKLYQSWYINNRNRILKELKLKRNSKPRKKIKTKEDIQKYQKEYQKQYRLKRKNKPIVIEETKTKVTVDCPNYLPIGNGQLLWEVFDSKFKTPKDFIKFKRNRLQEQEDKI